jgi:type I restriction enzyme, R subunit
MSKITETDIELLAIDELEELGWNYVYGPDIAFDGISPERENYQEVILKSRLKSAINRLNKNIPSEILEEAFNKVLRIPSTDLMQSNETFHDYIINGIKVEYQTKDGIRGDIVKLIEFDKITLNDFLIVNQFTIIEKQNNKRPDVVLFINGIPLVIVEIKNPADEKATVQKAFTQLQNYKSAIPSLFYYNAFLIVTDGLEAKAGTVTSQYSRFMAWKTVDGTKEASHLVSQMITLIQGMLNKENLLELIRHFIVFEKTKKEDPKTFLTTIQTEKKLAAYHQYFAVKKAVQSTIEASGINGDRKGGVVWHTQGSGKSLSMVFYTGKLVLNMDNPTIVIITDRNDLDDQLFETFASCRQLLRQEPVQAESQYDLKNKLKVAGGGIVFTTIQKFFPDENETAFPELSKRKNIIVIADEAHRTQYGFEAKIQNIKDDKGKVISSKIVYGFAKHIRDALPNATFIGFTGTPIELEDRNTRVVFGDYIDIYDIQQAVDDKATVRIYYESRLAKVNLDEKSMKLIDDEFEEITEDKELTDKQKAKAKWARIEAIVGNENRINEVAKNIISHFESRQEVFEGKALIVTMSRRIAVELYNAIIKLKPGWHNEEDSKGVIKVIMTGSSSDPEAMQPHIRNKIRRKAIAERMKDAKDELKIVIVRDMWLTGFDVPCLNTMYVDKPMKGHNLMQAIARVNRIYKDKPGGLIVDYIGFASELKRALATYTESGGKGSPTFDIKEAISVMLEKYEIIKGIIFGFDYTPYFTTNIKNKLNIILSAEEHILGLENGKERFLNEVTALSSAFALAKSSAEAAEINEEVAFFQAVKARLTKFIPQGKGKTDEEIETAIRQLIDKAVVTDGVLDVFDASGIKKPDISILSEEFLEEIRNMKRKNISIELLKKLLSDEITFRGKRNLVQSKTFSEMLANAVKKYQNNLLTAAEIIDELIDIAKQIKEANLRGEKLKLTEDEIAFYDALEVNDSAVKVLGDDTLKSIAHELVEKVKASTTIDWTIKENVKARMRVIVKRILRKYGYPPDKQKKAVITILKQAEMLADIWTTEAA